MKNRGHCHFNTDNQKKKKDRNKLNFFCFFVPFRFNQHQMIQNIIIDSEGTFYKIGSILYSLHMFY